MVIKSIIKSPIFEEGYSISPKARVASVKRKSDRPNSTSKIETKGSIIIDKCVFPTKSRFISSDDENETNVKKNGCGLITETPIPVVNIISSSKYKSSFGTPVVAVEDRRHSVPNLKMNPSTPNRKNSTTITSKIKCVLINPTPNPNKKKKENGIKKLKSPPPPPPPPASSSSSRTTQKKGILKKRKKGKLDPPASASSSPLGQIPTIPDIKITISPDTSDDDDERVDGGFKERHNNELKRILNTFIHAATTSCSCASNLKIIEQSDSDVEISWDDLARRCTDFGISDYLSASLDSDEMDGNYTDTIQDFENDSNQWLTASPPQRFSDPDMDTIEPLPVTLETVLNLNTTNQEQPMSNTVVQHQEEAEVFQTKPITATPIIQSTETQNQQNKSALRRNSSKERIRNEENIPKPPFRRQISLPPQLFTELYLKDYKDRILNINFQLNKQESLSESNKSCLIGLSEFRSNFGINEGRPLLFRNRRCFSINSSWENSFSMSDICNSKDGNIGCDEPPFTSDLEKRALLLRNMKKLVRQDTLGNFAPADFCI